MDPKIKSWFVFFTTLGTVFWIAGGIFALFTYNIPATILFILAIILYVIAVICYYYKPEVKRVALLTPSPTFLKVLEKINKISKNNRAFTIRQVPEYEEPKLIRHERLLLSKQERSNAKEIEKSLFKGTQPNDPCAAITEQIDWGDKPLTFHYSPTTYAEVRAKRKSGDKVIILSANTLVFSEEARCLLFHRRSQKSEHFPRTIHTIGGAFMPEGLTDRGDITGVRECAERELREETGVSITIPLGTPMAIIDEQGIDFIQIAFLGVNISEEQLRRKRPNWEGTLMEVPFDNLREILMKKADWLPSGWAHVVMWLALGAPGSKTKITFNNLTAEQLALEVVDDPACSEEVLLNIVL